MAFIWETPEEINMALAKRFSLIRKRRKLSQVELSQKSNVSYGSIKRFETSGQISLISLTKLCVALDCADEIRKLFTDVEYRSIDEVLREQKLSKTMNNVVLESSSGGHTGRCYRCGAELSHNQNE